MGGYALPGMEMLLDAVVPYSTGTWAILLWTLLAVALSRWRPAGERLRWVVAATAGALAVRYLLWRAVHTLNWQSPAGVAVSLLLFGAELYALCLLAQFLFQVAWPVARGPAPLPDDPPSVDVFVPIYNEPVDILYRTLVACRAMDYPRFTVWVLDDGRRDEVRHVAEELGCGYLRRQDNRFAKAGNLNHALACTSGELVAVLDTDHAPVVSFLRETVGLLLRDPRAAFVQTPHFFYNPDPFQRNLLAEQEISSEQDMFYRVVLPGRDRWNAAFFCGSGAVFRRRALEEIGGFQTGTITEDIHTSIMLHARGWRSLVRDRILAAGLAPEDLRSFLKQRIRWATGTIQMTRLANPLTLPGLSLPQRLCYFSSVYYFFFPFARIVFIYAPLVYLLLGIKPVQARLADLVAYYMPQLLLTGVVLRLFSRGLRGTVTNDLYETSTSFALAPAVAAALAGRGLSRFVVTPKGGLWTRPWFDAHVVRPQLATLALCAAAAVAGVVRAALGSAEQDAVLINMLWNGYNALLLAASVVAACEQPQRRRAPRFLRNFEAIVTPGGLVGHTLDVGERGARVRLHSRTLLPPAGTVTLVSPDEGWAPVEVPYRLVWLKLGPGPSATAALEFTRLSAAQRQALVRLLLSPAESWALQQRYDAERSLMAQLAWLARAVWQPFRRARPVAPVRRITREDLRVTLNTALRLVPVQDVFVSGTLVTLRLDEPGLAIAAGEHATVQIGCGMDMLEFEGQIVRTGGGEVELTLDPGRAELARAVAQHPAGQRAG